MTWSSFQVFSSPKGDLARILSSYSLTVSNFNTSSSYSSVVFCCFGRSFLYSSFSSSGAVSVLSFCLFANSFGFAVLKLLLPRELPLSSNLFSL